MTRTCLPTGRLNGLLFFSLFITAYTDVSFFEARDKHRFILLRIIKNPNLYTGGQACSSSRFDGIFRVLIFYFLKINQMDLPWIKIVE